MRQNMIIITSKKFYQGGGIPVSTENLFGDKFKIVLLDDFCNEQDKKINIIKPEELIGLCEDYQEVLFSGYDVAEEPILRILKEQGKKIFAFWHFGISIFAGETKHLENWASLTKCAKEGFLDLMLTCKAGFDEMLKNIPAFNGVPILRIRNNVMNSSYKEIPKKHVAGVYSGSGNTWIKNSFCNLAAIAKYDKDMPVDITPLGKELEIFAESLGLNITGVTERLDHDEFLKRMATCEFVMYVTMTEACPMLPLEAMMNGVPCLTGNNHDIFNPSPLLEKLLVVNRPDDPTAISKQLEVAVKHKNDILTEFEKCKAMWDMLYQQDLDHFLNYKFENTKTHSKKLF